MFLRELRDEVLENEESDAEIDQGTKPGFRGVLRTRDARNARLA